MMSAPVKWLLEGDPWIAYRTRVDLLGQPEMDGDVQSPRQLMREDPKIRSVLGDLVDWPGVVISSHKNANQPFHKLTFMADLRLRADDPAMENIISQILKHQSPEGPFQLPMNIPTQYGMARINGLGHYAMLL